MKEAGVHQQLQRPTRWAYTTGFLLCSALSTSISPFSLARADSALWREAHPPALVGKSLAQLNPNSAAQNINQWRGCQSSNGNSGVDLVCGSIQISTCLEACSVAYVMRVGELGTRYAAGSAPQSSSVDIFLQNKRIVGDVTSLRGSDGMHIAAQALFVPMPLPVVAGQPQALICSSSNTSSQTSSQTHSQTYSQTANTASIVEQCRPYLESLASNGIITVEKWIQQTKDSNASVPPAPPVLSPTASPAASPTASPTASTAAPKISAEDAVRSRQQANQPTPEKIDSVPTASLPSNTASLPTISLQVPTTPKECSFDATTNRITCAASSLAWLQNGDFAVLQQYVAGLQQSIRALGGDSVEEKYISCFLQGKPNRCLSLGLVDRMVLVGYGTLGGQSSVLVCSYPSAFGSVLPALCRPYFSLP